MDQQTASGADPLSGESARRCPNCGGEVAYDIKSGTFKCRSCGAVCDVRAEKDTVDEYSINDYRVRERTSAALTGVAYAKCDNCGAEIYFGENETAKRCPMCGSAHIRAEVAQSGIAPEGVVPFRIDKDDAQQRFREWVKKRWFAPNLLKKAYSEGALEGLYVPFWTYDAEARAEYSGQGGVTHSERDRDGNVRTWTEWFPVSGAVYDSFNDLLVCASKTAGGALSESIGPFNTVSDIKPFAPDYLTGYLAERYSIDGVTCFAEARRIMESSLHSMCVSDILSKGFTQANVIGFTPMYKNVTYKSVLLPMYTASYGYRGKTYSYAINGESGRVQGSYPKSAPKIVAAVLLALAVLCGLYWLWSASDAGSSDYYDSGYSSYYGYGDTGGYYGDYYGGAGGYYPDGGSSDGYYNYDSDPNGYLDESRSGESSGQQTEDGQDEQQTGGDQSADDGSQSAA